MIAVRALLVFVVLIWTAPVSAEPLAFGQGRLWRLDVAGQAPSYAFGTMHLTDPRVTALSPRVSAALAGARLLMVEVVLDAAAEAEMGAASLLPDFQSLNALIGPKLFADAASIMQAYGIPPELTDRLKPWVVGVTISLPPPPPTPTPVLDQVLQDRARAAGTPVAGIETIAEQIAAFESPTIETQIVMLRAAVEGYADLARQTEILTRAFVAGDLDTLHRINRELVADANSPEMDAFMARLLEDRSRIMAARLRPRLAKGGVFFAIGALHISGEDGVLALLERQGIRVSRVE